MSKKAMDKIKLKEYVISKLFDAVSLNNNMSYELTDELLYEMLKYPTIISSINTLVRGIASRELVVKTEDNSENDSKILDIQKRINNIKNKTKLVENLATACFNKMALHEILYNDDFSIKELVHIPNKFVKYNSTKNEYEIKIGQVGQEEIDINDSYKWLLSIYGNEKIHKKGYSVLEKVVAPYTEIKNIKSKMNSIINKYGETITIFAYGVEQSEDKVRETAEDLKRANGKNVIAMPMSDSSLKDNLYTIKLNDIGTEIHERLIAHYEKQITQILLGSTLSIDNSGSSSSYALGNIHQEEKEKVEDSIALFVRDQLDKLIDIDAYVHGYDPRLYYISIDREEKEEQRLQIDKQRQELRQQKAQELLTLSQAGYEISTEELKEITGFKTITKKEQPTFSI